MNRLNIVRIGIVVGIVSVVFFLLCVVWDSAISDQALRELHNNILRIAYPGFSASFTGILIGAVEAFAYGWILGALFSWLCNKICVSSENK